MITIEQALHTMREQVMPLGSHTVKIEDALHTILYEQVHAPFDFPRFRNSAVDGYGVTLSATQNASPQNPLFMEQPQTVAAGHSADSTDNIMRIMTGAVVPAHIEAVIMREEVEDSDPPSIKRAARPGENIRERGEEYHSGDILLSPGTRITPAVAAMLATAGKHRVKVNRAPKVTLISTGDELIAPGKRLTDNSIYDSNSIGIRSALHTIGITSIRQTHCRDHRKSLLTALHKAITDSDVIISAGGVSEGDFDLLPGLLSELGMTTHFHKVAIKPGKPILYGTWSYPRNRRIHFWGLPGNPVSALVTWYLFVKPALHWMQGDLHYSTPKIQASLQSELRKKTERTEFVRGVINSDSGRYVVRKLERQDSHMLGGLAHANALIDFPLEQQQLRVGDVVTVIPLEW